MNNHEKKINRAIDFCAEMMVSNDRIVSYETLWQGYQLAYTDKLTETQFKEVYDGIVDTFKQVTGKEI